MAEFTPINIGRHLAEVWGKLMMQKQFNNALLTGVLGYLVSLESDDTELKVGATSWISKTMEELQGGGPGNTPASGPACSFCGRGEPEVRLAAGAKAFVCDSCVGALSKVFASGKGTDA